MPPASLSPLQNHCPSSTVPSSAHCCQSAVPGIPGLERNAQGPWRAAQYSDRCCYKIGHPFMFSFTMFHYTLWYLLDDSPEFVLSSEAIFLLKVYELLELRLEDT